MSTAPDRRPGLSRVEVAAVGLIALLSLGLLVVALRQWRGHADRLHCAHHLKGIGESIFQYHQVQKHLPASCIDRPYATWAVQLAPQLPPPGNETLATWDLAATYYRQKAAVCTAQVPSYYCPARRAPPQNSTAGDVPRDNAEGEHHPGALGDYACASGDGSAEAPYDTPQANGAIIVGTVLEKEDGRILRWTARTTLTEKDLPRGTQYTILIGEKHVPLGDWGRVAGGDGSLYNGDYFLSFARVGGPGFGLAPSLTAPLNRNFGSYHPGLCNFLFADGRVDALATDVSETLLGQLIRRGE